MLVQQGGPASTSSPRIPRADLCQTSSVKLRRRNRDFDCNRYSGGDFLSSPSSTRDPMRKSGDWSYVSFPAAKSPAVTPKQSHRPVSMMVQQPVSILESKVIASIIHNETSRQTCSANSTPVAVQRNIDSSSLGNNKASVELNRNKASELSSAEEYTRVLRRRMIDEVLNRNNQSSDLWQKQEKPKPPPRGDSCVHNKRVTRQRRSQSAHGRGASESKQTRPSLETRHLEATETKSEVWSTRPPVQQNARKPGLGRRSATQLELSRKKTEGGGENLGKSTRWRSQEHLDTVVLGVDVENYSGAFAGGRKELARRLIQQSTEQEDQDDDKKQELLVLDDLDQDQEQAISSRTEEGKMTAQIKKGILWQQRDKIFARWKERFFVLTQDYLQCFKKGNSRLTEMGGFIYGIRLAEITDVQLLDKRGYLTICLTLAAKEGKLFLRKPEGIREWHQTLKTCTRACQDRRNMMTSEEFWSRKQFADSANIEQWLMARQRIGLQYNYASPSCSSPSTTWERDMDRDDVPMSLPVQQRGDDEASLGRRSTRSQRIKGDKIYSAPPSRPNSTTRSNSRQRRSASQHPTQETNKSPEHVYETPTQEVTSPTSARSRLSTESNGFCRDSGNDSMYTSSGGSTDSSNRDRLKMAQGTRRQPQRRHSEGRRVSAPPVSTNNNYENDCSVAGQNPSEKRLSREIQPRKQQQFHRHLPSQATRV